MKVSRVFCFSKDVARQNGNKLPVLHLVLSTILFIVAVVVLTVIMGENVFFLLPILMIAFIGVIIYYSIVLALRLHIKMSAFAVSEDNRIFKVFTTNNGEGLYLGGVAAGTLLDQLANNTNHLGANIGGAIGGAAQIQAMNKSALYMSHPEIVAQLVEKAPSIKGAEVLEILKVYSITENSHSIKINCDYKSVKSDQIKYRANMTIDKSYQQMNDLIALLKTHR